MALDEGVGADIVGELGEGGTRIVKDRGVAEEVYRFIFDYISAQVNPVDQGLFAWLGLESYLGADLPSPS